MDIRFFEEIAANAHVALDVMQYDGWLLRFSEGYTGRANSVSVLYPSTIGYDEKIAYCEKIYARKGLPCRFKVTDADKELTDILTAKGYSVITPTDVMLLDLADISDADTSGCIFSDVHAGWYDHYAELEGLTDPHNKDVFGRMLAKVIPETIYCTLMHEDKAVGCASAAIEHGYMLIQNVIVSGELRGKGLGERMCRALISRGRSQGAHHSYLQVVQDNIPAVNLYKKLGYKKIYSYQYMKK